MAPLSWSCLQPLFIQNMDSGTKLNAKVATEAET